MASSASADRYPVSAAAAAVAPPSRKSNPGQPWSHPETVHLIDAYEERWYGLKRGQLKAQQWEEVAANVAARCGFDDLSKNGTQCRHKIEKLRKRYRAERLRPVASLWPYFDRMDRMERGFVPLSARPPSLPASRTPAATVAANAPASSDEDDEDEEEEEEEQIGSNTRSINGILQDGGWGFSRGSRNPTPRQRSDFDEMEEEEEGEEEEEVGVSRGAVSQLAAVVRRFGDGLTRLEKRRLELMREMERDWMEMEARRAEMLAESQQCLMETITSAFASAKKAKKPQNS